MAVLDFLKSSQLCFGITLKTHWIVFSALFKDESICFSTTAIGIISAWHSSTNLVYSRIHNDCISPTYTKVSPLIPTVLEDSRDFKILPSVSYTFFKGILSLYLNTFPILRLGFLNAFFNL